MKKLLYGFAFFSLVVAFGLSLTEAAYVSPYRSYWSSIFGDRYSTPTRTYTPTTNYSPYSSYAPYRTTTNTNQYSYTQPRTYTNNWTRNDTSPSQTRRYAPSYYPRSYSNYWGRNERSYSYSTPTVAQNLSVTINPIRHYQDIQQITSAPISLFEVGVHNNYGGGSNYTEAVRLTKMTFEMFSNTGIAGDPRDFALRVDGQDFIFESDGTVTLQFHNLRLASGESQNFEVDLVVRDPQNTPHIDGALRVKITNADAEEEISNRSVPVALDGDTISRFLNFSPSTDTASTAGNINGRSSRIYGRTLNAGETAAVLSVSFEANYDDLYIKELTLTDTESDGDIDAFIEKIVAKDSYSGNVLGESRFVGGEAHFRFYDGLRINRRTTRKLDFIVQVNDRISSSLSSESFKLVLYPTDVEVWGVGSGRELSVSDKIFDIQSENFYVASGGGGMRISSSGNQPDGFAVMGSLQPVYRFQLSNPGSKAVALRRISMSVQVTGVEFTGGRSAADFEIKQISNGEEAYRSDFSSTLVGSNKVVFDSSRDIYIEPHSTREFLLKLKLDDVGGNAEDDYVTVQILGDSTLNTGTLSSVRSSGADFIWSDLSGSPHSSSSSDWISGYLVSGLPSHAYVNYRR